LLSKIFLALARRLDLGSALGQLGFLLLLFRQGSLLLPLLLFLLQLALPHLLLQSLQTSISSLALLCQIIFLRPCAVPVDVISPTVVSFM
jgi:hypothetical protein